MQEKQKKIDVNALYEMGFWLTPRVRVVAETAVVSNKTTTFKESIVAFHDMEYGKESVVYVLFPRIVKHKEKYPLFVREDGYVLTEYQVLQRLNGELGFAEAKMKQKKEERSQAKSVQCGNATQQSPQLAVKQQTVSTPTAPHNPDQHQQQGQHHQKGGKDHTQQKPNGATTIKPDEFNGGF